MIANHVLGTDALMSHGPALSADARRRKYARPPEEVDAGLRRQGRRPGDLRTDLVTTSAPAYLVVFTGVNGPARRRCTTYDAAVTFAATVPGARVLALATLGPRRTGTRWLAPSWDVAETRERGT